MILASISRLLTLSRRSLFPPSPSLLLGRHFYPRSAYLRSTGNFRFFLQLTGDETQQQLWRLQDFLDGGGLRFTIELFFLALLQLLSTSPSKESHSALYTGTFRGHYI